MGSVRHCFYPRNPGVVFEVSGENRVTAVLCHRGSDERIVLADHLAFSGQPGQRLGRDFAASLSKG